MKLFKKNDGPHLENEYQELPAGGGAAAGDGRAGGTAPAAGHRGETRRSGRAIGSGRDGTGRDGEGGPG